MYSVSDKYKKDMKAKQQRFKIRGTIGNISFSSINLEPSGSFSITNQCSDDASMTLGAVYIGQLNASFSGININRYEWIGQTIKPFHIRVFPDGSTEEIPLGVFTVDSADWQSGIVSVVAYDNMSKLDKKVTVNTTSGTAYDFLTYICGSCGVECGMTRTEVQALPNGSRLLGLYTENDIETFRDMLSWLAKTLAGYATVDRSGRIVIRSFNMDVVDRIQPDERFEGGTYADYETRYSGLSVVSIKNKSTRYFSTGDDIYLTYNMGSNPFIQYGSNSTIEEMCREVLESLAAVRYIPFDVTMIGDPAYDLGDVIVYEGGFGDSSKFFCIHRYTYSFQTSYEAAGVGENPSLANARSKTDKDITGLMSSVSTNQEQYYIFRNIDEINIGNNKTKDLFDIRFSSLTSTIVILEAEILLTVTSSGDDNPVGVVSYFINGDEVVQYHPTETWIDGKHILHLLYHLNLEEAALYRFVARLTMSGGSAYIAPQGVQASIHGQGLAAVGEWDGYLDFEETFAPITLGSISLDDNIAADMSVYRDIPYKPANTEVFDDIQLGGITLSGFTELLLVNKDAMSNYTHQQLRPYTHEDLNNTMIHG